MSQNTQYLYEYQNGKRIRNLGFMKIDQQMDKCIIQIYVRDMDEIKGILFQASGSKRYIAGWEPELLEIEEERPPEFPEDGIVAEEPCIDIQEEEPDIEVEEYIQSSSAAFEKIQRQDLSRLPRKEWRIANNSFLLHGFYNYHHLLYIEEEGEIWVGVPGIYHEKEKMAANAFGFTHFRRLADVPVELSEEEKNTYEDFGYWCRQIQNPKV